MSDRVREYLDGDPRPPFTFSDPGSEIPVEPLVRCYHCSGRERLIEGDGGRVVCRDCVGVLTRISKDPDAFASSVLDALLEVHGDVVVLMQLVNGTHMWRFTADWPGIEPRGRA